MRHLILIVILGLWISHPGSPLWAQVHFSKSIDVGLSSNFIPSMVESNGKVLMFQRHTCPPPQSGVCLGVIVYEMEAGFTMDTMVSRYPKSLNPGTYGLEFSKEGDYLFYANEGVGNSGNHDRKILQMDENGHLEDLFNLSPEECPWGFCNTTTLASHPEGGYYIFGQMGDPDEHYCGFYLARLTGEYELEWLRGFTLGGYCHVVPTDMDVFPDGSVIMTGRFSDAYGRQAILVMVDENGDEQWKKFIKKQHIPSRGGDTRITRSGDQSFVLGWVMDTLHTYELYRYSPKFIQYNTEGEVHWVSILGDQFEARNLTSLRTASNGDILGVGEAEFSNEDGFVAGTRGFIFRMSSEGEVLWENQYFDGSNLADEYPFMWFQDIVELPDGSLMAGGARVDTVGLGMLNGNSWVVRLDSEGNCNDPEACQHLEIEEIALPVTAVTPGSEVGELEFFPNPVRDRIFLHGLPEGTGELALYDLQGRVVQRESIRGPASEVEVDQLSSGVYILEYRSADGRNIGRAKMVVME